MAKRLVRESSIASSAAPTGVLTSAALSAVLDPPAVMNPMVPPVDMQAVVSSHAAATVPAVTQDSLAPTRARRSRPQLNTQPARRSVATFPADETANRQAELFYLQKQIQLQTQMVFILEDGERIQGVIEWYDRHSIKVRGKARTLIYKSAIKYLYKAGEVGTAPQQ